jgi:hypothetical protein
MPVSCSRYAPLICSSVNLDFLIHPLLLGRTLLNLEEIQGLTSRTWRTKLR